MVLKSWSTNAERCVGTDLVTRGYGETGRDFLAETRLPDGATAPADRRTSSNKVVISQLVF
jgi:hypothetical protein